METDVATPELAARLANVFPRLRRRPAQDRRHRRVHGRRLADHRAKRREVWRAGTRRVAEAGWRNENHSLTPGGLQSHHRRVGAPQRRVAGTRHPRAALGRRARAVHHAGVRRQAESARRRRQRARRLALHQRHGAAERPAVQAARRQRHPDRHELRRHADLADESVARPLLRRDGQERARRGHQRGPDARRATRRCASTRPRTAGS